MQNGDPRTPPLTEEERRQRKKERADAFWNIFLFTKDGKVKSTLIVNSFSLCVLFLVVCALAYLLLLDPLEAWLADSLPPFAVNLAESLIPAILATCLCCSLHFVFKNKKLVPAAYVWLDLLSIVFLAVLLFGLDADTRSVGLGLFALFFPAPLLLGTAVSLLLYRNHAKNRTADVPVERKPWEQ